MKRIMYKKLISYLLTVAILLSGNSLLFAQQIDYKPALSFEYDYFTLGKTNENDFVAKLKQDMYDNLYDSTSGPSNPYSKRESNVQKAYNNFLYYSMYPKKSPYWKYTAFEPDGVASEDDVLLILQKHKELSKEIEKLLKQNPEYKNKLANKRTLMVSGGFVLAALSVALWEIIPAAAVAAPATAGEAVSTAAKVGFGMKMAKAAKFLTVLGIDVASTDWMAYKIRTLEGIKENINDVDIYKSAIIENINERNLLKSQIENYQIQICSEAVENFNNMRTAYVATNGRAP
ncbi:MAG: hypothetical protein II726_01555, partial [Elusimicrobiaceae bacterium]|nr:hypothetical protein [Elusimicrobiaceae bacterium]